jgi:tetratricopeptide (TPR) repeat protein
VLTQINTNMNRFFGNVLVAFFIIIGLTGHIVQSDPASDNSPADLSSGIAKVDAINEMAFSSLNQFPEKGLMQAKGALEIADSIGYEKGKARSLSILGSAYRSQGNYNQAIDYYYSALRIYEQTNFQRGVAVTLNNIAEAYKKLGNTDEALKYQLRAHEVVDSTMADIEALLLNNLGESYLQLDALESAYEYYNQGLEKAKVLGNDRFIAYSYEGLGKIALQRNNIVQARTYFEQSLKLRESLKDGRGIVMSYINLADACKAQGTFQEALSYLFKAMDNAEDSKAQDLLLKAFKKTSQVYEDMGKNKLALDNYKKHIAIRDSLFNSINNQQINFLKASYGSKINTKENEVLKSLQEQSQQRLRTQSMFILGITTFLIVLGGLTWMLIRNHNILQKANEEMKTKNRHIEANQIEIEQQAEELKSLNEQLELKVLLRTEQLKDKNRTIARYLFLNTYKLRAPVSSILGLINLLQLTGLKGEPAEIATRLNEAADRMEKELKTIRQMLENNVGYKVMDTEDE